MNETLLRSWWLLALRGVIAVAFGTAAILMPAITLATLAALFAAFALLAGAVWIFGAIRNRARDDHWWVHLLLGVFSVGAGMIAALYPGVTIVALILLVGANALVTGAFDIVIALRVRKHQGGVDAGAQWHRLDRLRRTRVAVPAGSGRARAGLAGRAVRHYYWRRAAGAVVQGPFVVTAQRPAQQPRHLGSDPVLPLGV